MTHLPTMHDIRGLIEHHGDMFYLITFLWTALEGETFVIFAGLFAQQGMLNIWVLFVAAWLGSFCGDQIFFITGRKFGVLLLDYFPKLKPSVDRSLGWLERHAIAFILAYRFMYGIRNISGVAIGMSHLPWRKFAIWNAIAAFIWAAAFAGFGYMFGDVIRRMNHNKTEIVNDSVRQIMLTVLGLFLIIVVLRVGILYYQKRKRALSIKKVHDAALLAAQSEVAAEASVIAHPESEGED